MLTPTAMPTVVPPPPVAGPAHAARRIAERLAAVLRPVRLLDAVRWPREVEAAFLAAGGGGLPAVPAYAPPPFHAADTLDELARLGRDARDHLGTDHPAARLLRKAIREGKRSVHLVAARGTPRFADLSRELFGTTRGPWLPELTRLLERLADSLPSDEPADRTIPATEAAVELAGRFTRHFGANSGVRAFVCPDLSADASAGNGYLKLRAGATFNRADLRMLEVHEGWAHLATTLNARQQPVLASLSRCGPSATRTQEGLAVFLELVTGAASRCRVRKLLARTRAVAMAEAGADFRDVYRHFLTSTDSPGESYRQAARVFRGSTPIAGPFTKDVSYGEGLLRVLRFVRSETAVGGWGRVPLLFCGKAAVEDVPLLAGLGRAGWLAPPRWVPPPFRDRPALLASVERLTILGERPA